MMAVELAYDFNDLIDRLKVLPDMALKETNSASLSRLT